jgi:hypothetical protein
MTRDGLVLPIAAMGDRHLENTLNLYYQKLMVIKNNIGNATPLEKELYGVQSISEEKAAVLISKGLEEAMPYFIEAYLRGLNKPQEMLRNIYGRNTRLTKFDNTLALETGNTVEITSPEVEYKGINTDEESELPF